MADASRDTLRGLLIEDPRLRSESSIWTAESAGLTQAGRHVGRPTTSDTTSWRVEARGDQSEALDVQVLRSGVPGRGLGVGWKKASDAATVYRGLDSPVAIRGWQIIASEGGVTNADYENPDAVTLQNGKLVIVAQFVNNLIPAGNTNVGCVVVDPSDGTVGSFVSIGGQAYTKAAPYPWIIAVPREDGGERLIVGFWTEDSGSGTTESANIDVYFSDDEGANWQVYARSVLTQTTTINPSATRSGINIESTQGSGNDGWDVRRVRCAYSNGQILMMMHLKHHDTDARRLADFLFQWQSSDLASTFTMVDEATSETATSDEAYRGGSPSVDARDGLFLVAWNKVDDSDYAGGGLASTINIGVVAGRLGASSQRFSEIGASDLGTLTLTDGCDVSQVASTNLYELDEPETTITALPSGEIWVYWLRGTAGASGHEIRAGVSTDGATYSSWGKSMFSGNYGTVWDVDSGNTNPLDGGGASGITNTFPRQLVAAPQAGRVALLSTWELQGSARDKSVTACYLGGFHTQTLGQTVPTSITQSDMSTGWEYTWIGLTEPDDLRWNLTNAGTSAVTLNATGMQVTTTIGDRYWTLQPDGSGLEGLIARWSLKCDTGNTAGDFVAVRIQVRDGVNRLDVSIRYSSTSVVVYDNNATATLATYNVDMTTVREFELSAKVAATGSLVLYERTAGNKLDNVWNVAADVAPGLASSAAALHFIRWGAIASGTTDATWLEMQFTTNNYTGIRFRSAVKITNPGDLSPLPLSGRWTEISAGAYLRAVDGPGISGEEYQLPVAYDYGAERVLPVVLPSPSEGWRSSSTAEQSIALAYNATTLGTENAAPMGEFYGLHAAGVNFKSATLEGYVSGSGWTSIASITNAVAASYTRTGNVIEITSASLDSFVREAEFNGGWVDLGSSKRRRVQHTRGGLLTSTGGTVRRPRLILEGIDGTEPASGTVDIIPTRFSVVVNDATAYSGIRLKIASQSTVDGYFTIGAIVAGPVVTFGTDYSWGRVLERQYNVELNEARGGARSPDEIGPSRRTVEVAWTDGIDVTQVDSDSTTADYMLSNTGIEPAAYTRDVLYTLEGVQELIGGPLRPVVYLPALQKDQASQLLNRQEEAIYGRVVTPVRIETILGDENSTEVLRWSGLRIEEEV